MDSQGIKYIIYYHIYWHIVYIGLQNQLTIQHWLSLLQASTRSGWKRTSVKNIWSCFDLFRKKLIVHLEERFKCLPGVLKTPGQVLSPSGKEEHPVQDQGKLGQHRQCGVSGKITKIAPLDHLRKWSTLCKHSVNILDLIKIYEQYKYSLTGFLAQTEIVLSFFLCLNVNLETRKQS